MAIFSAVISIYSIQLEIIISFGMLFISYEAQVIEFDLYLIKRSHGTLRTSLPNCMYFMGRGSPDLLKIAVILIFLSFPTLINAVELSSNTVVANAGYYQLSWEVPGQVAVLVEESTTDSFHIVKEIYRGNDTSTAISGKPNGNYYYRAKSINSPQWSETVRVSVEHHSLAKAFLFFFFGMVVFASTCFVIIRNHKNT